MGYYNTENTFVLLNNFLAKNLKPEIVLEHPMIIDWLNGLENELVCYAPQRKEYFVRKLNQVLAVIKKNTDAFKEELIGTLPMEEKLCS